MIELLQWVIVNSLPDPTDIKQPFPHKTRLPLRLNLIARGKYGMLDEVFMSSQEKVQMSESTPTDHEAETAAIKEKRANYFATNKIIEYEGLDKDTYLQAKDYLIIQKILAASPIGKDVLFQRYQDFNPDYPDKLYGQGYLSYSKSEQSLFIFFSDEWAFDFGVEGDNTEWHGLVKEILIALDDEKLSNGWGSMFFLDDDDDDYDSV